jgi:hypothetical protein
MTLAGARAKRLAGGGPGSSEGLGRTLWPGPGREPPKKPALGGIRHEHEREHEEPVVVLKSRLAHSYRDIHCFNKRSALDNRGHCRDGRNPERSLFF